MIREKRDCCGGGGRLRIDFPGMGMVTAEEDGGQDEMDGEEVINIVGSCPSVTSVKCPSPVWLGLVHQIRGFLSPLSSLSRLFNLH